MSTEKKSFNKKMVLNIYNGDPTLTVRQIADKLGARREYVYATLRRANKKINKNHPYDNPKELREQAIRLLRRADHLEHEKGSTEFSTSLTQRRVIVDALMSAKPVQTLGGMALVPMSVVIAAADLIQTCMIGED